MGTTADDRWLNIVYRYREAARRVVPVDVYCRIGYWRYSYGEDAGGVRTRETRNTTVVRRSRLRPAYISSTRTERVVYLDVLRTTRDDRILIVRNRDVEHAVTAVAARVTESECNRCRAYRKEVATAVAVCYTWGNTVVSSRRHIPGRNSAAITRVVRANDVLWAEGDNRRLIVGNCDIEDTVCAVTARITEGCLLYTSPSPRDATLSRMPSSA